MTFPEIIFEDDHLVVIDKPFGLTVNRSITTTEDTLQDLIERKYPHLKEEGSEFLDRSGIVHRLDKPTSGVLLIAKDEKTYLDLKQQFKERKVKKHYVAIVYGNIADSDFEIDAPILRNPNNRMKFAVSPQGKAASTLVEKKEQNERYTFLDVYPKTGRTHQIRVHLTAYGNPIVGDHIYASKKQRYQSEEIYDRLMLHALSINVFYKGENIDFESRLPSDFKLQ